MKKLAVLGAAALFVIATVAGADARQAKPAAAPAAKPAAAPADPAAQARAAIEAIDVKFAAAMMKGDAAGAAAVYASDAILMLPDEPMMKGSAAISAGIAAMLKEDTIKSFTTKVLDVTLAGDYAIETGTFEMTTQPAKGPAETDKGQYVTVWKKQAGGGWKIVRDISNSSVPPGK